jgi:flagellar biogenesis protein FliO
MLRLKSSLRSKAVVAGVCGIAWLGVAMVRAADPGVAGTEMTVVSTMPVAPVSMAPTPAAVPAALASAPATAPEAVEQPMPHAVPVIEGPSAAGVFLVVIIYIVVLAGLGAFVVWLYRRAGRLGGRGREGGIEVLHQRMIGPRQILVVARYRDYDYVLGVTAQHITRLDARPVDEAASASRLADEALRHELKRATPAAPAGGP